MQKINALTCSQITTFIYLSNDDLFNNSVSAQNIVLEGDGEQWTGNMWKEEAEVYLTVLQHHLPGGTGTINNLSQHSMCLDQDLN